MLTFPESCKRTVAILVTALVLQNCAPKKIVSSTSKYPPLSEAETFIVFTEEDPIDISGEEIIGEIRMKDNGLSLNCSYESILAIALKEARHMGANGLKIYEHQVPDTWSTCHRIKAKAIRLQNAKQYEKEIIWQPGRRLEKADFKGPVENRPHQAATMSFIRYNIDALAPFSSKFTFRVQTVFDCRSSYLKDGYNPEQVLEHEQGHFDITELFARKYLKAIQEQVHDLREFEKNHTRIYQEIQEALILGQDNYDSDIYADISKQKGWLEKINQELKTLEVYSDKKIELPVVNKDRDK